MLAAAGMGGRQPGGVGAACGADQEVEEDTSDRMVCSVRGRLFIKPRRASATLEARSQTPAETRQRRPERCTLMCGSRASLFLRSNSSGRQGGSLLCSRCRSVRSMLGAIGLFLSLLIASQVTAKTCGLCSVASFRPSSTHPDSWLRPLRVADLAGLAPPLAPSWDRQTADLGHSTGKAEHPHASAASHGRNLTQTQLSVRVLCVVDSLFTSGIDTLKSALHEGKPRRGDPPERLGDACVLAENGVSACMGTGAGK